MRKDVKDKVFEGGKTGRSFNSIPKDISEDAPTKMSASKIHASNWSDSYVRSNTNIVEKFLRSKVGKPWNKVWSEFCEGCKDHKVREWCKNMVEDAYKEDGKWWTRNDHEFYGGFYVDIKTGILGYQKRRSWRRICGDREVPKIVEICEFDGQTFARYEEIWYRVKFKLAESGYDVLLKKEFVTGHAAERPSSYYGKSQICIEKQAANKREIKKLTIDRI